MGPRNPTSRGGRNSRPPRRRAPVDRRKSTPTDLRARTRRESFSTSRSAGQSYVLKFRRLLPLDDSSIAVIHRWLSRIIRSNRKWRLAYVSAELRTLGPLYESKITDDSDDWQSQWVNSKVIPKASGWGQLLTKALTFKLEEIELLNEGRVIWLNKVRLVLFNVQGSE